MKMYSILLVSIFLTIASFGRKCEGITNTPTNLPLDSGVYCIGPSAHYTAPGGGIYKNGDSAFSSVAAAVTYLNEYGTEGNVIFEIQNDYDGSLEPDHISITYHGSPNKIATFRVRIDRTSPFVIEKENNNSGDILGMLDFYSAAYIQFDGTINNVANKNRGIVIRNIGNATNNISFRESSHISLNNISLEIAENGKGVLNYAQASVYGNEYITMDDCKFAGHTLGSYGYYEDGVYLGTHNVNTTIINNEFDNCITSIQGSVSPDAESFVIANNHFYKSSNSSKFERFLSLSAPYSGLITIEGNYFGGTQQFAGGSKLMDNRTDNTVTAASAIEIYGPENNESFVKFNNNVLQNISFGIRVILLTIAGNAEVHNNIFGNPNVADDILSESGSYFNGIKYITQYNNHNTNQICSIVNNQINNVTMPLTNPVTQNGDNAFYGITIEGFTGALGECNVSNNSLKHIHFNGRSWVGDFVGIGVYGSRNFSSPAGDSIIRWNVKSNILDDIWVESASLRTKLIAVNVAGNANVSSNIIGSTTNLNSIRVGGQIKNAIGIGGYYGFFNTGIVGNNIVDSNIISNIELQSTGNTSFNAIEFVCDSAYTKISCQNNYIQNIQTAGHSDVGQTLAHQALLNGIVITGGEAEIANNTIAGLQSPATNGWHPMINGIVLYGDHSKISNNRIHNLTNRAITNIGSPIIFGIYATSFDNLIANNSVALNNSLYTNAVEISGIVMSTSGKNRIFHNSVSISGSSNQTIFSHSYALQHYNTNANHTNKSDIRNNIFCNTRQTNNNKNFAIGYSSLGLQKDSINDNALFTIDSLQIAEIIEDNFPSVYNFAAWKSTYQKDSHSKNTKVIFTDAGADLNLNLYSNCLINNAGTPTADVTTDIIQQARNVLTPDLGAYEFEYDANWINIFGNSPACDGLNASIPTLLKSGKNGPVSYEWSGPDGAIDNNISTLNFSPVTMADEGIYTVTGIDEQGCRSDTKNSPDITVLHTPTTFTITGGGTYPVGDVGVPVGLNGSEVGISYSLFLNNTPTGISLNGTGLALSFGNHLTPGIYSVRAVNPPIYCPNVMSGTAVISNFVSDTPVVYSLLGGGSYCSGGSGKEIILSASQLNTNYQLKLNNISVGSSISGTGTALNFGYKTAIGKYTVVATNLNSAISKQMRNTVSVSLAKILTPAKPGTVTGPKDVCGIAGTGKTVSYFIKPVVNATSYEWTVPSGATLIGGNQDTLITVSFDADFVSGDIAVFAKNNCGPTVLSGISNKLIVGILKPTTPGVITGTTKPCNSIAVNHKIITQYSIAACRNATYYTWAVPFGATIMSGQGTRFITVQYNFNKWSASDSISVIAKNNCSSSPKKSLSVKYSLPAAPKSITGFTNVCAYTGTGTEVPYTAVFGLDTYNIEWIVSNGIHLVSGQNTNTALVTFDGTFTSGTVKAKGINSCGFGVEKVLRVTSTLPVISGNISGPSNVCPYFAVDSEATYSIPPVPNAIDYNWSTPQGSYITDGYGTNSIKVKFFAFPPAYYGIPYVRVTAVANCGESIQKKLKIVALGCTPPPYQERGHPYTNLVVEENNLQAATIHPNPNNGQFTFRAAGLEKNKRGVIVLYNSTGEKIDEWPANSNNSGIVQIQVDKLFLPSGIYFVRYLFGKKSNAVSMVKK